MRVDHLWSNFGLIEYLLKLSLNIFVEDHLSVENNLPESNGFRIYDIDYRLAFHTGLFVILFFKRNVPTRSVRRQVGTRSHVART